MDCGCCPSYLGPSLSNTCYGGSFIFFMSILDTLIRHQCELSDLCGRITPRLRPDPEYDFVVIGGGAAGSVVAARLSENPDWKVLLIEAGGDEPPGAQVPSMSTNFIGNPYMDWNFKTEPQDKACLSQPDKRCAWPRGKVLGGSGEIHGMMYMRGVPKDYDEWEQMGNTGWGYENVLHYFKKSEGNEQVGILVKKELHGTDGPMVTTRFPDHPELADGIMRAAEELGYPVVNDLNEGQRSGFTRAQANIINGSRLSSARAFLRPARKRRNLHIMINSTATKIILQNYDHQKTISEVEFIYKGRLYRVKVKHEAILSAGAINSPHLLLLSGIGPKEELDKVNIPQVHDLPGVGKNLQNHVSFGVRFKLKLKKDVNDLDWLAVYKYLLHRKGPMSSTGMAQVTARLTTKYGNSSEANPDLQLFFEGFEANCSRLGLVGENAHLASSNSFKTFLISPVTLRPRSRGYIGLKSNKPLDPPLMQPNYFAEEYDFKILIEGVRIAQKLANTKSLRTKFGAILVREEYGQCGKKYKYDSDQFWECAIKYSTRPENHQAGSCKMGPASDLLAVVDSKLKLHGVEGVRVADASIMPKVVSGNPHGTIVMIGEKAAHYIKERYSENS